MKYFFTTWLILLGATFIAIRYTDQQIKKQEQEVVTLTKQLAELSSDTTTLFKEVERLTNHVYNSRIGVASWLNYQLPDTCATRDWPKGTVLAVYSIDKPMFSTICVVRDYGPDPSIHPNRIIDLSRKAFEELAPASQGLLYVTVEPL